jgi:hypothetical protein
MAFSSSDHDRQLRAFQRSYFPEEPLQLGHCSGHDLQGCFLALRGFGLSSRIGTQSIFVAFCLPLGEVQAQILMDLTWFLCAKKMQSVMTWMPRRGALYGASK